MADWSKPTTTSSYATEVLQDISARLNDVATMFSSAPSNQPTGTIRWNTSTSTFQSWDGTNWNDIQIAIGSGGTGASSASGARTNLGLGSLSVQNSSSVTITGGSVASSALSGLVPTANLGTGTADGTTILYGDQTWKSVSSISALTGEGRIWYGSSAPSGWLICDGSAISRSTYSALFAIIGVTYGSGDGSTTFNIPDLRQRFPIGKAASGTASTLGATGGSIDHTHTSAAHTHTMGNHTHTMGNHTHFVGSGAFGLRNPATTSAGAHTHTYSGTTGTPSNSTTAQIGSGETVGTTNHTHNYSGTTDSGGAHTHSIVDDGNNAFTTNGPSTNTSDGPSTNTSDSTTPGATGSNNPPYLAINYIIKT